MEKTILSHLIVNEAYCRRVIPYLNDDLFPWQAEKTLFGIIESYVEKYNAIPTKEILYIELENIDSQSQDQFNEAQTYIQQLETDPATKDEWLLDQTEKFIQDRSLQNAIRAAIGIMDDDSTSTSGKDSIPQLVQDALAISFDTHIGHDYFEDATDRFESYSIQAEKIRFNLDYFNRITDGGVENESLNCILSPTGGGKTLAMCSFAAGYLMDQLNVLYVTLEMSDKKIASRIDANLLNVTLKDLKEMPAAELERKMKAVNESTKGRFIVKGFPATSCNVNHLRHMLNELRIKKNFIPDVIFVDYINLMASARIKPGQMSNSYVYIKSIAEELRGLAQEFRLPIWTATQANRDAYGSSDIDLDNTADSMGLPMTVDMMFAVIPSEEFAEQGLIQIKQLKNRYGDENINRRFFVSINKNHMRLVDAPEDSQPNQVGQPEDKAVMDNGNFMEQEVDRHKKFDRSAFKGFK